MIMMGLKTLPVAPPLTGMSVTRVKSPQLSLLMGPVSTAVLVYVAEKFILRLTAGQILRKGVSRKMRRLTRMLLDCDILVEVLQDVLEDFADYTSM